MECVGESRSERRYVILAIATFVVSFLVYLQTVAPSVSTIFDDSLELQLVSYQLGIAHPTGYPLYTILGKLLTLLPLGTVAFRANLLSALTGALTAVVISLVVARISGRHLAGFAAGLALAVSPVFWSQSTIAEVYTLNALIVSLLVFGAVLWQDSMSGAEAPSTQSRKRFWLLAFVFGLGLAHHRSIGFMLPAILVFVFCVDRRVFCRKKMWLGAVVCAAVPLLLYLYIPVRGMQLSSLDGTYKNTLGSFLRHVTGVGYNVFLTDNPLGQSRAVGDYVGLFYQQFGWVGLVLGAIGFVYLLSRWRKFWGLTAIAFVLYTLFGLLYQVADIEVFFIPSFLFVALWIGFGLAFLMDCVFRLVAWVSASPALSPDPIDVPMAPGSQPREVWRPPADLIGNILAQVVPGVFLVLVLLPMIQTNYPYQDRSEDWKVHDYGRDVLQQPLDKKSTIVGILGEMTLLRYFQQTEGLRSDVETVAADDEPERRNVIMEKVREGRSVYLTRPLSDIAAEYALSAVGPLTRVQSRPGMIDVTAEYATDIFLTDAVHLLGYNVEYLEQHWQPVVRVTLFWEVTAPIPASYKVSARLYNMEGHLVGQTDAFPVHDTYPTTAWTLGEVVRDVYDIRIVPGAPAGPSKLLLVLYRPENGQEVARAEVGQVMVTRGGGQPPLSELDVDHVQPTTILNGVELLGYSLPQEHVVFEQGDRVPLNLLWRLNGGPVRNGVLRMWLDGAEAWQVIPIPALTADELARSVGPVLLRQWTEFPLTARVPDGTYSLYVAGYATEAESQQRPAQSLLLGKVTVKGRERVFDVPEMLTQVGAVLDRRVTLLGFDLSSRSYHPGDALTLTLYWRARTELDTSYTVFVHLVGEDGRIWAQQDNIPHNGEWPTTGWMQGEVVSDEHELTVSAGVAPGVYRLITGMYQAESGQRLTAAAGNDTPLGDFIPLTEIVIE